MIFKNPKIQKIVSVIVIISMFTPAILVFSVPREARAFLGVGDIVLDLITEAKTLITSVVTKTLKNIAEKDVLKAIANEFLKAAAKRALASITKRTVAWINNGFHGSPLFVENSQSFFKDITKFEIKDLISVIGYDPGRFPFGKQFALNTIDNYKRTLEDNATYSLSKVVNDPTLLYNYRSNFSYGGWNGFLLNTQYPQNNFIGSQILLNNELARRLNVEDINTSAGKIQDTLNKGQGFLSPQVCPPERNPNYPKDVNPFSLPTWSETNFKKTNPYPDDSNYLDANGDLDKDAFSVAATAWEAAKNTDKANFNKTYDCPGGLVNTTPGSVVANSIMTSLTGGQRLTELQAALGGSLSAVFDAVLNKFLGKGLSSLASSANSQPYNTDNWDYLGNTLGSPSNSSSNTYNEDVFNGPDQVIVLSQFKNDITTGIKNTKEELLLMDNDASDPSNLDKKSGYGIIQMLSLIWPKARELDICTPGPDLGWESRLAQEEQRNSQKFQADISSTDGAAAAKAQLAINELKFAVNYFKDWIQTKEMGSLPRSIIYMDAVSDISNFDQQAIELNDRRKSKNQTLERLKAIQESLASAVFATDPAPGSTAEKELITIKKQYDAISYSISNPTTIEETRAELEIAKEKSRNLGELIAECRKARTDKRWTVPNGNWSDTLAKGSTFKSIWADAMGKTYYGSKAKGSSSTGTQTITLLTTGEEQEQFCNIPITSGYSHDPFINFNPVPPEYKNLPLVNALTTLRIPVAGRIAVPLVSISCNLIYRSTTLDYKGSIFSIPGLPDPEQIPWLDDTGELTPDTTSTNPPPANNSGTTNPPATGGTGTNPPPTNPPDDCGVSVPCG